MVNSGNSEVNRLASAKSPYLRQHSENPVHWQPWSDDVFEMASNMDRLVIVSIGYSACHWCHVMERESFSNPEVAELMNRLFVCVKVDREEYPDVDDYYMEAVQVMTGQGGWPLNCFVLPDKRPIYGGTYFPPDNWKLILERIASLYRDERKTIMDYARKLSEGTRPPIFESKNAGKEEIIKKLDEATDDLKSQFDIEWGGTRSVPKFPLPSLISFWMEYGSSTGKPHLRDHALLTLRKISAGGIFDHLQGGFARYSTDREWKVPHFEKMLYDNAQLLTVLADAFRLTQEEKFLDTIALTVQFLQEELSNGEGAYYAALDADSEGEEGKYYSWSLEELQDALGDYMSIAKRWFRLESGDAWEAERYVLMERDGTDHPTKKERELVRNILKDVRASKIKPALDTKIIISWNALTIKALAHCYLATGERNYLSFALAAAAFMDEKIIGDDGKLWHVYGDGMPYVDAFLEDYAHLCDAYLLLHTATSDPSWLAKAHGFAEVMVKRFYDPNSGVFWTSDSGRLPQKRREIFDNVMPSSEGVACDVLRRLGIIFERNDWSEIAERTALQILPLIENRLTAFSNWAALLHRLSSDKVEIVFSGPDAAKNTADLMKNYLPSGAVVIATRPIAEVERYMQQEAQFNSIYVCREGTCFPPVENVSDALALLS